MSILILGGDMRQKYVNDYFREKSYSSAYYACFDLTEEFNNVLKSADVIVLPLPISKDGVHLNMEGKNVKMEDLFERLASKSIVLAGSVSQQIIDLAEQCGLRCIDYYKTESFQIKNALLTAEGAIYYAQTRLERSIYGANTAVLGFGRIGKILAYLLHAQGAEVTIGARKASDLHWSKLIGFNIISIGESEKAVFDNIGEFEVVFNTVPYWIISEQIAQKITNKTQIIDLASSPFGIDEKLVQKHRLDYRRELRIPGRYAPKSAGELIAQTIIELMEEQL